jgi:hypothetical protein
MHRDSLVPSGSAIAVGRTLDRPVTFSNLESFPFVDAIHWKTQIWRDIGVIRCIGTLLSILTD